MRTGSVLTAALLTILCAGCTGTTITRGEGQTIAAARAEDANGPKYRIAVANIIDKTDPASDKSLSRQIGYINARRKADQQITSASITSGIRDLLTTELFNSGQFIVLERDTLSDALVEQEFAQSAKVGDSSRIPLGQLEGAELLVVGALTAFDAGVKGGAIPIPVPFGKFSNGFGVLNLSFKRGFAAMDLRVIDTATGRIVASTAVEGSNSSYGLGLQGLFTGDSGYVPLPPGLVDVFSNTPVEKALQKMVAAAIGEITKRRPSKPVPAAEALPEKPASAAGEAAAPAR